MDRLASIERILATDFLQVERLGSGTAPFVRVHHLSRSAVVSVDNEAWLVELWSTESELPLEETVEHEFILEEEAQVRAVINRWMTGLQR
jgi:hypothetical protein